MMQLKRRLALGLVAAATVSLSGCGFRLRGADSQGNLRFATLHLAVPTTSPLRAELIRNIRGGNGTQLVEERSAAQAVIELLSESREKAMAALNDQGRIREYSLLYKVRFRITDGSGKELLPPSELLAKRETSFNEAQAMAKEKEEEVLYRDMQGDLARQILRRLAALKPA